MRNNATTKQQRDEEQSVGFDPKQRVRLPNEATILQHPSEPESVPRYPSQWRHNNICNSSTREGGSGRTLVHPTHDPLFTSDAYNKATANNVHRRRLAYDLCHTLRMALFPGLIYTTLIGGSQER